MSLLPKPHVFCELPRRIERALADCLVLARYELAFEIEATVVTLKGCVASYYHKQLAQESLRQVVGLQAIRNEIEVRQPTP
ncbi:MAG: BON domain-containing protein [Planctomycetales bacterium]|nr:BON domain-containing protein [Planctomycetales bacterium]